MPRPRRVLHINWAFVLGLLAAFLGQLAATGTSLRAYDEGLVLYGAARVAHGDMPYHDFWSMYGPGSFYVLAGLNRLFGESVLLGRILDAAARAGVIVLLYGLIHRRGGRVSATVAAAIAFLILAADRDYLFPALPATGFVLLTLCLLDTALRRPGTPSPWAWAFAGAAAGATFLFRPDFGVGVMAACLWALLIPLAPKSDRTRPVGAAAVAFLAGGCAVVAPLFGWLLTRGSAWDLYDNLVRIPMQVYVANRGLPFPRPLATLTAAVNGSSPGRIWELAVYLPPLVAVAGISLAFLRRRRWRAAPSKVEWNAKERLLEASLVALLMLCAKGAVRVEVLHMLPALIVAIAIVGMECGRLRLESNRAWHVTLMGTGLLAASGLAAAALRAQQMTRYGGQPPALVFADWPQCANADNRRLGCFRMDADRSAALRYLKLHAKTGDLLYVGAGRHDKLFANNVELYFLSGLPAATKWAELHPGVQTRAEVQKIMIAEMQAHPPAFVVRNTVWDNRHEPNASRFSSGVTLLDDYLRLHYVPDFVSGPISVSVPRGAAVR